MQCCLPASAAAPCLCCCSSLHVRSQLPYACCLLTIVIEMSDYKQLLLSLLQVWLASAARTAGRVMPEWQLPLSTAGCSASAWETEAGWSTSSRGLSSVLSSLTDLLLVLLQTGKSLEQFLCSSSSWVEFQTQDCSF